MSAFEVIERKDARYPSRLTHLGNPPKRLYMRGRIDLVERVTLGVVGSRDCTEYGIEVTRALVTPAAQAGAVIVSGLARGIDAVAHEAALDAGSTTIAVLGCGIDICYPKSNQRLFDRIAEEGLLLSEFEPGTQAFPYNFPHRNRIIAMLSHSLLVVEAAENSGTKHTAEVAMEFMDVLAVPGPIGRPTSVGTNRLLRDGATVVISAQDILDSLRLERVEPAAAPPPAVSADAKAVWKLLTVDAAHVDEIAARSRLPTTAVSLALLELELSGRVRQLAGGRYVLARQPL